jgi:general stress protein 26
MTEQNHVSRVWDVIEKVGIGMLTTRFAGGLRARPMEARADRGASIIWFLTDVRGAKDNEIDLAHEIGLVFIDAEARAYLSITGRASIMQDTAQATAIWKKTDDAWWPDGPRDPNMRVLRVVGAFAQRPA